MKISIIGASSFLGQTLYQALDQTQDIRLFSRTNRFGDQAQWAAYNFPDMPLGYDQLAQSSVIFYCAGAGIQPKHQDSESLIYEMNAFEPIRLINALKARNYGGKLVTFGSYFEIGNQSEERLYTELDLVGHTNKLPNAYCIAKNMLSRFVYQQLQQNLDFVLQHFVLTNIYGAAENPNRLLPYIVQSSIKGDDLSFTAGVQQRQYTHIQDVADFLAANLTQSTAGIFNLTDPRMITVRELIEKTLELVESKLNIRPEATFGTVSKRDLSMKFLGLDTEHLQNNFTFVPKVTLDQGIAEYINRYGTD